MKWIGFKYLGHRYMFDRNGTIYGKHLTNDSVPAGKLTFSPETTQVIKTWCDNMGFAGLSLEDYLDKVLGSPK